MDDQNRTHPHFELLYFFADWTGAHAIQGPRLQMLRKRDDVSLRSIDLEDSMDLAERHKVDHLPTFILMDQGRELGRFVGIYSIEEIEDHLRKLLPGPTACPSPPAPTRRPSPRRSPR